MKRLAKLGWMAVCVLLPANSSWGQGPCMPLSPYQQQNCNPPWAIPPALPQIGQTPVAPSTTEGAAGGAGTEGAGAAGAADQQGAESQAQATERGGEVAGNFDGPMFGDIVVPASSFQSSVSPQVLGQLAAAAGRGGAAFHNLGGGSSVTLFPFHTSFKISENEFPRPVDRVWVTYNYYSDVPASGLAFGATGAQVHREMAGAEKTFLNGNASIGIRVPVFWVFGATNVVESQLGDISVVFKYAFYGNRRTGNFVTGGLVVTAPTGPSLKVPGQSSVNSTVFQPWVGDIWHWGRLYNINFTSFAFPTDARDISLFFESFALGYLVYRNSNPQGLIRAIVPDAEFHANIPLNHSNLADIPIGFPNVVDFTGGCYFFLRRAVLGMAAGTPLTGPRPYGVEALASLNYIF
jgi:hypothetical protein